MFVVKSVASWFWRGAFAGCLAQVACANAEQPVSEPNDSGFAVIVQARRDGQQPLAGVKILDGKRVIGTTDASGNVKLKLKGAEGDTKALTIGCPDGFASPEKPIVVGLRQMARGSPSPKFETECLPMVHTLVVGVRAEHAAFVPIRRLSQVIGKTDQQGIAHVLVQAAPNEQVTLTLDTSALPNLRPQSPTLTFVARDRDEMVLLEQKFTVHKPVVRARKKSIPQPL